MRYDEVRAGSQPARLWCTECGVLVVDRVIHDSFHLLIEELLARISGKPDIR